MSANGQLRLSGGRRLLSPAGQATRPTTSRVREAVMNILAPHLGGSRWLDLCSGSGVMGCEALRRGASHVLAIDRDPNCVRISQRNLDAVAEECHDKPTVRALRRDVRTWIQRFEAEQPFDLVYFDPPYDAGLYDGVLSNLIAGDWLHADSIVICEHRTGHEPNLGDGWWISDQRQYGLCSLLILSPQAHCHHGGTDSKPRQTNQ